MISAQRSLVCARLIPLINFLVPNVPWELSNPLTANLTRPNGLTKAYAGIVNGPTGRAVRGRLGASFWRLPVCRRAMVGAVLIFCVNSRVFKPIRCRGSVEKFRLAAVLNRPRWAFQGVPSPLMNLR
jgi:hypothetical protein